VSGSFRFEMLENVNHWVMDGAADHLNRLLLPMSEPFRTGGERPQPRLTVKVASMTCGGRDARYGVPSSEAVAGEAVP
jgi:hypothetical protein